MLDRDGGVLIFNGFLDRDDVHADARASLGNHRSYALERHLRHEIEKCRKVRMLVRELVIHHHELGGSGHEDWHIVLLRVSGIFPV